MTNREKKKVIKAALDAEGLLQVKYENNRLRIVEPWEFKDRDNVLVVQTKGYSKSGLSKAREPKLRRTDNIRTFELDKILSVKEVKK